MADQSQITVDCNGGAWNNGDTYHSHFGNPGNKVYVNGIPKRVGYTFTGWFDAKTGGNRLYSPFVYPKSGVLNVYAQWEKIIVYHTVTFNDGFGYKLGDVTVEDGKSASFQAPTRSGYQFARWDTDLSSVKKNLTVTALWTCQYVFEPNGGTGGKELTTVDKDAVVDIPAVSRTGYTLSRWNGNPDGTYKDSLAADAKTIQIIGFTRFYAIWTPNKYTVTFDPNEGTVGTKSQSATYDSTYGTLPTPTRTDYRFLGWYTAKTGGTNVTSDTKVTTQADHTLYAHWTDDKYTVTFDANGGSVTPSSKVVKWNTTYGTLPTPTRTGYSFSGWYTLQTGGTNVTSDTKVTTQADHTLYAHWTGYNYTVKFNANGGTGTMANQSFVYGTAKALTANAFTRTGYKFGGWATTSSGSKAYDDKESVSNLTSTNNGTANLFAVWVEVLYTVTFNSNNTALFPARPVTEERYGGIDTAVSGPSVSKEGFSFAYWYKHVDGKNYRVDMPYHPTADITLYAEWTANHYDLTIDPNGGVRRGSPEPYTETGELVSAASGPNDWKYKCTRTGHTFKGVWDAKNESDGEKVWDADYQSVEGTYWQKNDAGELFYVGKQNLTVYAQWSVNRHKVKVELPSKASMSPHVDALNADFGIGRSDKKEVEQDYGTTVTLNCFDDMGGDFKFSGWYRDDACTDLVSIEKECNVVVGDSDATYYPKYVTTISFKKDRGNLGQQFDASIFVDGKEYQANEPVAVVEVGSNVEIVASMRTNSFFGGWFDYEGEVNLGLQAKFFTGPIYDPKSYCLKILDEAMQIYVALHCWDVYGTKVDNAVLTMSGDLNEIEYTEYAPHVDSSTSAGDGKYYRLNGPQTVQIAYTTEGETNPSFRNIETIRNDESEDISDEMFTNIPISSNTVIVAVHGEYARIVVKCGIENDTLKGLAFVSIGNSAGNVITEADRSSASCEVIEGRKVTVSASAVSGYKFVGWYNSGEQEPAFKTATATFKADKEYDLKAKFVSDDKSIFRWQGSSENKTMRWSAKKMVGNVPFNPSCARIDAVGYPVKFGVSMTSSPDKAQTRKCEITVKDQDARRLKLMRPERYLDLEVESDHEVDAVFVGTSMNGIRT